MVAFALAIASSEFSSTNVTIWEFSSCTASLSILASLPCVSKENILQYPSVAVRNLEFTNFFISSLFFLVESLCPSEGFLVLDLCGNRNHVRALVHILV